MKYEIITKNVADRDVRIIDKDGGEWWAAPDLAAGLEVSNASKVLERIPDDYKQYVDLPDALGRVQRTAIVNKKGVQIALMTGRTEAAHRFRIAVVELLDELDRKGYVTKSGTPRPAALDPQVLATAIGSAVSAALAPLVERITRLETPRRGPLPGGTGRGGGGGPVDARRSALTGLDQLSVRAAANVLGVSRDTVRRWRADEEEAPPTPEPAPLPSHPVLSETQAFLETIAWVQRNESSFYRPLSGTPPPGGWVGKIDDKHVVLLRAPLVRILGYRFQHIIREWARRGWLRLESKGDGRFRPDKAFKLAGKRHRGYHIPIDYLRR